MERSHLSRHVSLPDLQHVARHVSLPDLQHVSRHELQGAGAASRRYKLYQQVPRLGAATISSPMTRTKSVPELVLASADLNWQLQPSSWQQQWPPGGREARGRYRKNQRGRGGKVRRAWLKLTSASGGGCGNLRGMQTLSRSDSHLVVR